MSNTDTVECKINTYKISQTSASKIPT